MVARGAWFTVSLCALVVAVGGALAPQAARAEGPGAGFRWFHTWSEASAAARAQGTVVLVSSTRAGCCLCDRFRNETAPRCAGRLHGVAVGYVYNIQRPENFQVDRVLRANLPGARLMPLVGFLTPDMQWVHGFWGGRSATQLIADIDYVRRVRPATAGPAAPAPQPAPYVRPGTPPTAPPALPARPALPPPPPPPVAAAKPAPSAVQPPPREVPAAPPLATAPPAGSPAPTPLRDPEPSACAPSARPTDECCPGGKCDVPSVFDDPCAGVPTFPRPSSPVCPPAAVAPPIPGVPDTASQRRALDPRLVGSPDGEEVAPERTPVARTFPPPAPAATPVPRPSLGEALRTSSQVVRPDAGADLVQAAADAGRWGEVLRRAKGSSDLRVLDLERRARQWAQDELARGLEAVLLGRTEEALAGLRRVKTEMAGEPSGVDAEHGIDAIETSRDLQRLSDPSSVLARSLRRNKYDELRGTRWARLFEGA